MRWFAALLLLAACSGARTSDLIWTDPIVDPDTGQLIRCATTPEGARQPLPEIFACVEVER